MSSDSPAATAIFELIAARTGLQIRAKDRAPVERALEARQRARGVSSAAYLALLSAENEASGDEWRALTPALTNGESYFWRDRGQFAVLREILPALCQGRGGALRIWSAGCSSGEETYSLAMLARELFSSTGRAQIRIVGTDLNEEALARARRGFYGKWSFRGVDEALRDRYFERREHGWQIGDELRAMVSFRRLNLAASPGAMRDFDLIVCRNVLIYFAPAAAQKLVEEFGRALRAGGFLLAGHAELAGRDTGSLTPRLFPESVIYQKNSAPETAPESAPLIASSTAPPLAPGPPKNLAANGCARPFVNVVAPAAVPLLPATLDAAQRAADAGRYDQALTLCRAAIERDGCDSEAYLLWARVEIERGELAHAKNLLKKVVYLAPHSAAGFEELGALYQSQGDGARAQTMRAAAARLNR